MCVSQVRLVVDTLVVDNLAEVEVQLVEQVWEAARECHWLVVVRVEMQRAVLHPTLVELGFT